MMKLAFAMIVALPLTAHAAQENRGFPLNPADQVYRCDLLRGADGGGVYGGPSYAVVLTERGALLRIGSGVMPGRERSTRDVVMQFERITKGSVEYRADDIFALVTKEGRGDVRVTIERGSGDRLETAECKL